MAEKAPVPRTDEGQFPVGVSGNPKGRPKGSKNQITLLRQSLEIQLREQSNPKMGEVLEKALELALEGDRSMIKLLLELHMSKQVPEAREASEKVQINIRSENPPEVNPIINVEAEEAEFTEVTEDAE